MNRRAGFIVREYLANNYELYYHLITKKLSQKNKTLITKQTFYVL